MTLSVEHISKRFGDHRVLEDVSLQVDAGEAVALLGGNGAGKTTLLRIVTRLLPADEGQVRMNGHPMTQADMANIGYLPEERGLYRHMRVWEQGLYFAQLKGMRRSVAEQSLARWFGRLGMQGWERSETCRLSKGMQQRLQLAITLVHAPSLLILDEPLSGFDASGTALLSDLLREQKEQGVAILLSTHNEAMANEICDRTCVL